MALLQETFTESLNAGASPITYEGNEGREQQVAQAIWDKLPPQARMQFGSFQQFFNSGAWKKVLQAMQQQMQGGQEEIQETETVEGAAPAQGLGSMMQGPRTMAHGGRPGYGLGSLIKKITRPVKKVLSSDLGKIGLTAAGIYGLGGGQFFGHTLPGLARTTTMGPKSIFNYKNILPNIAKYAIGTPETARRAATSGILGSGGAFSPFRVGAAASLVPLAMSATGTWDKGPEAFERLGGKFNFDYNQMREDISEAVSDGDYEKFTEVLAKYNLTEGQQVPFWDTLRTGSAQGGRIGYRYGTRRNGNGDHPLHDDYWEEFDPDRDQEGTRVADLDAVKDGYSELIFGKPLHELTPDELIELEIILNDKLGGPFSKKEMAPEGIMTAAHGGRIGYEDGKGVMMASASDPLDEKNQYSLSLFGKPLHKLTPDELIDLDEWMEDKAQKWGAAQGGRIGAQEGGLMNLGGLEKDYRNDGGFVPIGEYEKKDDVPARLSKNEFVFTADAVRGAGGGDIDKGAEVMENVMKNLEQGGEISEDSQGLQGARDMFAVSERLSEVV
jgi:hypothetical protein